MVQLILTLTSGVQVVYVTDEHDAAEHVQAIRAAWESRSALTDLVLGSDDGATDWVRLEHISAVRVAPAHHDEEGQTDAAGG
jgi:hypothetical protein